LPEAAHPYYVLAPHVKIDFASPAGPNPPVDEYSVKTFSDEGSVKFLNDPTVKAKLAGAKKLSDVASEDYDAIFYIGGQGPVLDLASDPVNAKLASQASTICFEFLGLSTAHSSAGYSFGKMEKLSPPSAMVLRKDCP